MSNIETVVANFSETIDNLSKITDKLSKEDIELIGLKLKWMTDEEEINIETLDIVKMIIDIARGLEICYTCGAVSHFCQCDKSEREIIG